MVIRKMYALNIKPYVQDLLRDYIPAEVWNEINATDVSNPSSAGRTDRQRIIELYRKYGTHVTTKTFYGCMYEYIMHREQTDWETSIEKLLKMNTVAKVPTKRLCYYDTASCV